jgi:hypothetical protein
MKNESIRRALSSLTVTAAFVAGVPAQPAVAADPPVKGIAQPAAATASDKTHSERRVRITWDRAAGVDPPDVTAALARLRQPEVLGPIAQEVLGLPADQGIAVMNEPQVIDTAAGIDVVLTFDLNPQWFPKARPASKEFADRVVARLTELLRDERREHDDARLALAEQAAKDAQTEYEGIVHRLREIQLTIGGQSPDAARTVLAKLEDERQRIELELAGIQARQQAVGDWIDRASKRMEEQAKSDPVVAELEKAVAAQERFVEVVRKQVDAGVSNTSVVAEAESKLSDVRVQLLDRKRGSAGSGGTNANADALSALNRELQNLSIDIIDRKARLMFLEKRLATLQAAVQGATDYDLLESERQALRKDLENMRQQLRVVRRAAQASPQVDRVVVTRASDWKPEQTEGVPQQQLQP